MVLCYFQRSRVACISNFGTLSNRLGKMPCDCGAPTRAIKWMQKLSCLHANNSRIAHFLGLHWMNCRDTWIAQKTEASAFMMQYEAIHTAMSSCMCCSCTRISQQRNFWESKRRPYRYEVSLRVGAASIRLHWENFGIDPISYIDPFLFPRPRTANRADATNRRIPRKFWTGHFSRHINTVTLKMRLLTGMPANARQII